MASSDNGKVAKLFPYREGNNLMFRGKIGVDAVNGVGGKVSKFFPIRLGNNLMLRGKDCDGKIVYGWPYRDSNGNLMGRTIYKECGTPTYVPCCVTGKGSVVDPVQGTINWDCGTDLDLPRCCITVSDHQTCLNAAGQDMNANVPPDLPCSCSGPPNTNICSCNTVLRPCCSGPNKANCSVTSYPECQALQGNWAYYLPHGSTCADVVCYNPPATCACLRAPFTAAYFMIVIQGMAGIRKGAKGYGTCGCKNADQGPFCCLPTMDYSKVNGTYYVKNTGNCGGATCGVKTVNGAEQCAPKCIDSPLKGYNPFAGNPNCVVSEKNYLNWCISGSIYQLPVPNQNQIGSSIVFDISLPYFAENNGWQWNSPVPSNNLCTAPVFPVNCTDNSGVKFYGDPIPVQSACGPTSLAGGVKGTASITPVNVVPADWAAWLG